MCIAKKTINVHYALHYSMGFLSAEFLLHVKNRIKRQKKERSEKKLLFYIPMQTVCQ